MAQSTAEVPESHVKSQVSPKMSKNVLYGRTTPDQYKVSFCPMRGPQGGHMGGEGSKSVFQPKSTSALKCGSFYYKTTGWITVIWREWQNKLVSMDSEMDELGFQAMGVQSEKWQWGEPRMGQIATMDRKSCLYGLKKTIATPPSHMTLNLTISTVETFHSA